MCCDCGTSPWPAHLFLPFPSTSLLPTRRPAHPPARLPACVPPTGAIEMSGFLELKCEILRGGMEQYLTPMGPTKLHVHPLFEISPLEPRFSEWLVFEGISVDETGKQHFLDATGAPQRMPACPPAAHLRATPCAKYPLQMHPPSCLLSMCPCSGLQARRVELHRLPVEVWVHKGAGGLERPAPQPATHTHMSAQTMLTKYWI